jgi:hypothetical protein
LCRDKSRLSVPDGLTYEWALIEGHAKATERAGEFFTFTALSEPGLLRFSVRVRQGATTCTDEAAVTVTDQFIDNRGGRRSVQDHGLPGHTFEHAPTGLWRSRHATVQNLIVVNNGHRDFVYANRNNAVKLRCIARLYVKEMVQRNFPGASAAELLQRMIELTLYMQERLR